MLLLIFPSGLGASGEGGARAGARPQRRADQAGEAGADGAEVRQEGGHEGDLAPGEPEAGGSGTFTRDRVLYSDGQMCVLFVD